MYVYKYIYIYMCVCPIYKVFPSCSTAIKLERLHCLRIWLLHLHQGTACLKFLGPRISNQAPSWLGTCTRGSRSSKSAKNCSKPRGGAHAWDLCHLGPSAFTLQDSKALAMHGLWSKWHTAGKGDNLQKGKDTPKREKMNSLPWFAVPKEAGQKETGT